MVPDQVSAPLRKGPEPSLIVDAGFQLREGRRVGVTYDVEVEKGRGARVVYSYNFKVSTWPPG